MPVYTGMTVSNEFPLSSPETATAINAVPISSFTTTKLAPAGKPLEDAAKDYFKVEPGVTPYYANPGDQIYITVTFDNPDDFVILSFTLNGKSYSSYMFEEGSDMENIVLKVDVGDVTGLVSYTIDAIKYVDGEKIKDVKIGGDRTVNVGIYNENQPTASVSDISFNSTEVGFDADVIDEAGLISAVDGRIYAVIYDGETVVAQREITVGSAQSVSFDGLTPLTDYSAAIVAVFDAYDGNETAPHVLCEVEFTTRISAFAKNITVNESDVSFELFCANDSVTVTKTELLDAQGNIVFSADGAVTEIKNVPGGKLRIRISYSYTENGNTVTDTADTELVCTVGMLPMIGEISAHYDSGIVTLPPPFSMYYGGHFGTDIIPTTDNAEVYSITDGVITSLVKMVYKPENMLFVCGKVEILDDNGIYHYYKFLNTAEELEVGDRVNAGDVLGTLCDPRENDMTLQAHLHYERYTIDGETKEYLVPEFDTAPRILSEQERIEKIAYSEEMLVTGRLNVSGERGSSVTYTTSFDFTYDDESVALFLATQNEYVKIEKLDNGQYAITCDFEGITTETTVSLRYSIYVANNRVSFCDFITLTLTPTDAA